MAGRIRRMQQTIFIEKYVEVATVKLVYLSFNQNGYRHHPVELPGSAATTPPFWKINNNLFPRHIAIIVMIATRPSWLLFRGSDVDDKSTSIDIQAKHFFSIHISVEESNEYYLHIMIQLLIYLFRLLYICRY